MNAATLERWFDVTRAFDHPVTLAVLIAIVIALAVAPLVSLALYLTGRLSAKTHHDILLRWRSWLWLVAMITLPILFGAAWVIAMVMLLSLLCYREYARATGMFREKTISAVVVLGIFVLTFAAIDHFPRLYFATAAFTVGLIAVITIPHDRPKGYIQRVALGVLGFLLFGYSFGYISLIANDASYRPILILMFLTVEANDIFAYCCGKLIGGPKILPNTSPNKTIAGSAGAVVCTTLLFAGVGHYVFFGTRMDSWPILIALGAGVSVLGQLGDLLVSSIKRDLGIKDIGRTIPGHGGLLDRFDSLVLVPPVLFHVVSLVLGPLGSGQLERIFTGG